MIGLILGPGLLFSQNLDLKKLKGPYLGQKSPGDTPELFAEGVITSGHHEHNIPAFNYFVFMYRKDFLSQTIKMYE